MWYDHKLCLTYPDGGSADALYSDAERNRLVFSTGSGTGTFYSQTIDLHATGTHHKGEPVRIALQVAKALAGGGTLAIDLETDDDSAFGSKVDLVRVAAAANTFYTEGLDLFAGYRFLGSDVKRYLRLELIVATSEFTAGELMGGIIVDEQSN